MIQLDSIQENHGRFYDEPYQEAGSSSFDRFSDNNRDDFQNDYRQESMSSQPMISSLPKPIPARPENNTHSFEGNRPRESPQRSIRGLMDSYPCEPDIDRYEPSRYTPPPPSPPPQNYGAPFTPRGGTRGPSRPRGSTRGRGPSPSRGNRRGQSMPVRGRGTGPSPRDRGPPLDPFGPNGRGRGRGRGSLDPRGRGIGPSPRGRGPRLDPLGPNGRGRGLGPKSTNASKRGGRGRGRGGSRGSGGPSTSAESSSEFAIPEPMPDENKDKRYTFLNCLYICSLQFKVMMIIDLTYI